MTVCDTSTWVKSEPSVGLNMLTWWWKVRGSPQFLRFILRGTWTSEPHFITIIQQIFQSESERWMNDMNIHRATKPSYNHSNNQTRGAYFCFQLYFMRNKVVKVFELLSPGFLRSQNPPVPYDRRNACTLFHLQKVTFGCNFLKWIVSSVKIRDKLPHLLRKSLDLNWSLILALLSISYYTRVQAAFLTVMATKVTERQPSCRRIRGWSPRWLNIWKNMKQSLKSVRPLFAKLASHPVETNGSFIPPDVCSSLSPVTQQYVTSWWTITCCL